MFRRIWNWIKNYGQPAPVKTRTPDPEPGQCIGLPGPDGKAVPCDYQAEEGDSWCKECGEHLLERFREVWTEIAHVESGAPKEEIRREVDRILDGDPEER